MLLLGAAGAAVLRGRGGPALRFRAHARLPGYRALVQGGTGGGGPAALAGLGGEAAPQPAAPAPETLCARLFDPRPGRVPVAIFTDHRCAVCKVVEADFFARHDDPAGGISVHALHWPALGGASIPLAKAGEAARLQGPEAWRAMHERLTQLRGRPSDAWIAKAAREAGLEGDRLVAQMHGPEVARALREAAELAWLFGFVGTPGLVLGRTSASGALSAPVLQAVLEDERAFGPPPGCSV